jgi:hypothetical protein
MILVFMHESSHKIDFNIDYFEIVYSFTINMMIFKTLV